MLLNKNNNYFEIELEHKDENGNVKKKIKLNNYPWHYKLRIQINKIIKYFRGE